MPLKNISFLAISILSCIFCYSQKKSIKPALKVITTAKVYKSSTTLQKLDAGDTISYKTPTTFCEGGNIVLTAWGGSTYQWKKDGLNITAGGNTSSYTAKTGGSYTVVVDGNESKAVVVTVNPSPIVDFNFNDNACSGTSVQFTSNVNKGTAPFTYTWNFGDASTDIVDNPSHIYNSLGCGNVTFNVTLTVTDANGCSGTKSKVITIKKAPDVGLADQNAFSPFSNCDNSPNPSNPNYSITVNNNSASASCITSYSLDWGDGNSQNNVTFPLTHTYKQLGAFNLTVTAIGSNGCTNSKSYTVANQSNPDIGIGTTGSTIGCAPLPVSIIITTWAANSPGTTYLLSYGDGTSLSLNHPINPGYTNDTIIHNYSTSPCPSPTFQLKITATNACKSKSFVGGDIEVKTQPTAGLNVSASGCVNQSICFTNTSVAGYHTNCSRTTQYDWDFGDGTTKTTTGSNQNECHSFSAPGTYTITLTTKNPCGSSTVTKQVCISAPPSSVFTIDKATGCAPITVNATNASNTLSGCVPATYNWTVTYSAANCGSFSSWSYTNNTTASSVNPSFVFANPGTYTITLSVTNACSTVTSTKTVVVKRSPTVSIASLAPGCGSTTINPSAGVTNCGDNALSYAWNFGTGNPTTSTQITPGPVAYTSPGSYSISLTATNECGATTDTKTLVVNPKPDIATPPNQTFCTGVSAGPFSFSGTLSGTSYSWHNDNTAIGLAAFQNNSSTIPTFTTTNTGPTAITATITLTATNGNCTSSSIFTITINPKPQKPTVTNVSYCQNAEASPLTATASPAHTLVWYSNLSGGTGSTTPPTPSTAAFGTTIYYVSQINSATNCEGDRAAITATVYGTPVIRAYSFINPSTCNSATGSITLTGLNPNVPYTVKYNKDGSPQSFTITSSPTGSIVIDKLTSGNYDNITVTINGCTSAAGGPISLSDPNPPATPTATANGPLCSGQTLSLTASSATPAVTYRWSGPNNYTSTSSNPTISPVAVGNAGIYSVTASLNGCTSAAGTVSVQVNATPGTPIVTSNSPLCSAGTLNLSASSPTSGVTYNWTGPNTFASNIQNPTITNVSTTASGTYTVTASNATCTSAPGTVSVAVKPTPVIGSTSSSNPTSCSTATGSIILNGLANNTRYDISFTKDGAPQVVNVTSSSTGTVNISSLAAGLYDNIVVSLNGCPSTPVGPFTLSDPNPPATPLATSTSPICSGGVVNLFANTTTAGPVTYLWTGPAGYTSNAQNPSITNAGTNASGTYSVTAKLNGCNSVAGTVNVQVNATPALPTIGSNSPVCTGNTLNLTSNSSTAGVTYTWTGPGTFTSTDQNPTIQNVSLTASGTYKVTASTATCTSPPATTNVVIRETPVISGSLSMDPLSCNSTTGNITLKGLLPKTSYTAYFTFNGSGSSSVLTSEQSGDLIIIGLRAGTYTNVYVSLNGCPSNLVGPFTLVDPTPPATPIATNDGPICSGNTLSLKASTTSSGAISYTWTGPNGFASNQQNPLITNVGMSANGTYNVTATISGCTSATGSTAVVINESPAVPSIKSNSPVCTGIDLNLFSSTNFSGNVTYAWTGPNNFNSTLQNPVITNTTGIESGTYTLMITASTGNCPSPIAQTSVLINPTPLITSAKASNPTNCNTATGYITLEGLTPGSSYKVSYTKNGLAQTATIAADSKGVVTIVNLTSGIYDKINVTLNGCPSNFVGPFTLADPNPPAAPVAASNSPVCSGDILKLTATSSSTDAFTYTWSGPNGFADNNQNPTILGVTTAATGTYSVYATLNNCKSAAATVDVIINATPVQPTASSNAPICEGGTLNLTSNTTSGGTISYSWTGPNGFTSIQQNPSIPNVTSSYTGAYTVTATAIQGTCTSKPTTIQVTVHPAIINTIDTTSKTICSGQQVTIAGVLPAGGNGIYTYQWEQSTDSISWSIIAGQTSQSLTFTPTSTVYVRRIVSSSVCSIASQPALITVQAPVSNNTVAQDQSICIGTVAPILIGSDPSGANGKYNYKWEQSTNGGQTWTVISNAVGKDFDPGILTVSTKYRRIITTDLCNGPQSSTSPVVTITVNPDAKAVFAPKQDSGCAPFVITSAIINATQFNDRNQTYEWYANGKPFATSNTFPGYILNNSGDTVIIMMKAISKFGCRNDSASHLFFTITKPQPAFTVSDTVGCGPLTVTFTNLTPNIQAYKYQWKFGNGQTSNLANPRKITFATNPTYGDTVYTVSMTVYSQCDTITTFKNIRVQSKPKALFTPDKTVGCSPMTVTFSNTSKGLGVTYKWLFGDGDSLAINNSASVKHTFTTSVQDTFYTKLIATNPCGSDTTTYAIVVSPNRIRLDFAVNGNETNGCKPHAVKFINNSSGATSFRWDFGDGNILTTTRNIDTVTHTYNQTGKFIVTLQATNGCSDTTDTEIINVFAKPLVDFAYMPSPVCIGDSIQFTNRSDTVSGLTWKFGDGNTSNITNPKYRFTAAGTYNVTLIGVRQYAVGNACLDSAQKTVTVLASLPGSFTVTDSVSSCVPFTVTFTNNIHPSNITTWDFGDGKKDTGDVVTHTFLNVGSFKTTMTATSAGGCKYVMVKSIAVNGPAGTFTYDKGVICGSVPVRFQVNATGTDSIRYNFGDGTAITTANRTVYHNYLQAGNYLPSATLLAGINGTCRLLLPGVDTIKVDIVKAGFREALSKECGRTIVSFVDTSRAYAGIANWSWSFGNGNNSSLQNPTQTFTSTNNWTIQLITISKSGCSDTAFKVLNVKVNNIPVSSIVSDSAGCTGQYVRYVANVLSPDSIGNYQWTFTNGAVSNSRTFDNLYSLPGNYNATFIATTIYGCRDTVTKAIVVNPSPTVKASDDKLICKGQSVQLNATGAPSYSWGPLYGLSCYTCANPIANPTISTAYEVIATNQYGCAAKDTVNIKVVQPFNISVSGKDTLCTGQSSQLVASGASKYVWFPSSGLNRTDIATPIASPALTTRYRVVGYDNEGCFTDTAYITVAIGEYPTVDLGPDKVLSTGTLFPLLTTVTNGPIRNWSWTPNINLSCSTCPLPVATIKKDITYLVKATTFYGCSATDTINIKVFCENTQLFIPNLFTPNDDGINDKVTVLGKGIKTIKMFRIFNRWGELVFERANFSPNDPSNGWDGTVKGTKAPPDVYVYTCEVICENDVPFVYKGNVALIK
jgi:large repetitive protein